MWQTRGPVAPMRVWMTALMGGHGLVPNRSQDGRLRCELVIFFGSWGSWKWNPPGADLPPPNCLFRKGSGLQWGGHLNSHHQLGEGSEHPPMSFHLLGGGPSP